MIAKTGKELPPEVDFADKILLELPNHLFESSQKKLVNLLMQRAFIAGQRHMINEATARIRGKKQ